MGDGGKKTPKSKQQGYGTGVWLGALHWPPRCRHVVSYTTHKRCEEEGMGRYASTVALVAALLVAAHVFVTVESVDTKAKSLSFLRSKAIPMLSPEKCATLANSPPSESILEKERCSICELIVENSRQWNWVGHYSSMCEGVPPHAQEWCEYYACKLAECGFFRSNTCKVINSVDQRT